MSDIWCVLLSTDGPRRHLEPLFDDPPRAPTPDALRLAATLAGIDRTCLVTHALSRAWMEAARTFGHLLVQHGPDAARLQLALTDPLIADDDTIVWLPCDLRCDRFEALRDSIIEAAGSNAVARGHLVQIEQVTLARANAARRYADAGTTEPAAAA